MLRLLAKDDGVSGLSGLLSTGWSQENIFCLSSSIKHEKGPLPSVFKTSLIVMAECYFRLKRNLACPSADYNVLNILHDLYSLYDVKYICSSYLSLICDI